MESQKNFETLMGFETKYGVPPGDVPELYTSFGTVQKTDNIREKLTGLVETELSSEKPGPYSGFISSYMDTGNTGISTVESIKNQYSAPLNVIVFQKPGCRTCSRLNISMRYLTQKYPGKIKVSSLGIGDDKAKVLNEALCIRYKVQDKFHLATPAIFFGEKCYAGEPSLKNVDIVREVLNSLDTADKFPTPVFSEDELLRAERSIVGRYSKISWLAVLSAGLIDGINPCAFVTIIFLLSYLAVMKYGRRDIILVGISFTGAVFLTYLGIGLGFLKFVEYLQSVPLLTDIVYYSAAFFAGVVGMLNLKDYIKIRKGSLNDMDMKLGDNLRQKINAVIRKNVRLRHYVIGAVFIGFGVSVLELACTGQTYLPTILFIVNTQGLKSRAAMMLVTYNFAFIVPLVAVFGLYLYGVTDKQFSAWLGRHGAKIKLSTGIIFIALALVLVFLR